MNQYAVWLDSTNIQDIDSVGGKNASLGEMITSLANKGVRVPNGFATTIIGFKLFIEHNKLKSKINNLLKNLDTNNINALTDVGAKIRGWIENSNFPQELRNQIVEKYKQLKAKLNKDVTFAVRSSATAEDLPNSSFAGQQESYLNVSSIDDILLAIKKVFASLYNDRAIAYRVHQGFEHSTVSLSAGVQQMVRSDIASSGVMFTVDTETGFNDVVFITSAYGLGETVVQGSVNPDEFYVYKPALKAGRKAILSRNVGSKKHKIVYAAKNSKNPVEMVSVNTRQQQKFSLNDEQIYELARYALIIEEHYQKPMDIEWALDGNSNKIYIVQARPETVQSKKTTSHQIDRYTLKQKSKILVNGRAIGQKISSGVVRAVDDVLQMNLIKKGDVLVTDMTNPDWEPIMKIASAIVTNRGGRTCHAAIIARELGIPAIVGTTNATKILKNGDLVTVSCAEGDNGHVYDGILPFERNHTIIKSMPKISTKIMINIGNPSRAFDFSSIPNSGVGLARLEFIINTNIGIHPKALLELKKLPPKMQSEIKAKTTAYKTAIDFYISKLTEGISTIAAAFAGKPVIIRTSDFKSNEYANLYAGKIYEPNEENPMIGFRGAARYISQEFRDCFKLECQAIKIARDEMGLTNIEVMIPFVRTIDEAKQVIDILKSNGLKRGVNGLRIIMMCELPANAILAEEFLQYFDGFSIGSNDMTQLTLGIDRDSGIIAHSFDERNLAVKKMLKMAIDACHKQNKYIGICGQGPSDHADLARWLLEQKISSISLNHDTVIKTWMHLEQK